VRAKPLHGVEKANDVVLSLVLRVVPPFCGDVQGATAYEVRRWEVLRWVVGELKEDLAHDLLHDYMYNLWD
jgi:hypothetical protein